jgi:hypothetical protein
MYDTATEGRFLMNYWNTCVFSSSFFVTSAASKEILLKLVLQITFTTTLSVEQLICNDWFSVTALILSDQESPTESTSLTLFTSIIPNLNDLNWVKLQKSIDFQRQQHSWRTRRECRSRFKDHPSCSSSFSLFFTDSSARFVWLTNS